MIEVAKTLDAKIYFIINPEDIDSDGVVLRGEEVEYVQFWPYVTRLGSELVPLTNNKFLESLWMSNLKRKSKNWAKASEDWTKKFLNREVAFTREELKSIETSLIPTPNDETPSGVKKKVRRRVLPKKKSMAGRIELKVVNKPNKPNLPNAPSKPGLSGGAPSARVLKPAVFDPRSVDVDSDGWHQEGTTAAWFGAGLNNQIVESLRSEMRLIQGAGNQDLTHMANLNQGYFGDAPPPLGSTLEADLSWLGGKLLQANVTNPGMIEGRWLVGREQVRKQSGIREDVLPTPDISELSDSDILENLERVIDTRKKARVAKDAKTRVMASDNLSDEAADVAKNFDFDAINPDDVDEIARAMFNFQFVGMDDQKYSVELGKSHLQRDDDQGRRLTISGKIFKDGKEVGFFDRTIYLDKKTVAHDHMHLDEEIRGAQISGIINSRNELVYRALGCDAISTKATSNIGYNGATHWPKVGFDWEDDYAREVYFASIDSALTKFALGISEEPDALPMIMKYDDSTGSFVNLPIFASREEAEEVALLLTLARTQSMDDPDRLTSGDLVNWSGAESWFQINNIEGNLFRNIGGQEDIADVPEIPTVNAPEVPAKISTTPNRLTLEMFSEELEAAISKIPEQTLKNEDVQRLVADLRYRAESPFFFENPGSNDIYFPGEPEEDASFQEDLDFLVDQALSGEADVMLDLVNWLTLKRQQRYRTEHFGSAERDELYDFRTKEGDLLSVDVNKVVTMPLDPVASEDRIKESQIELLDLQSKMVERIGRPGAEWRHISFINSNGEEVTMVRGIDLRKEEEVKAAIAHEIGSVMAGELSLEDMIVFTALLRQGYENRDQLSDEFLNDYVSKFGQEGRERLVMTPEGRVEYAHPMSGTPNYPTIALGSTSSSELAYRELMGEYIADQLLGSWATSSNRGLALGIQSAVERVFSQKDGVRSFENSNEDPQIEKVYEAFVEAQYAMTQTMFKEAGITKITTHRGMIWYDQKGDPLNSEAVGENALLVIGDAEVELQPVSSTAFNRQIAYGFAGTRGEGSLSVVVHSDTPVERILSSAFTGIGCLNENELTLIGGGETRFNLSASAGRRVDDAKGNVVEVVVDRFRGGETIKFSTTERLKNAGYSEEEIKKIQDYMTRNAEKFPDIPVQIPSINEIKNILQGDEVGLTALQM